MWKNERSWFLCVLLSFERWRFVSHTGLFFVRIPGANCRDQRSKEGKSSTPAGYDKVGDFYTKYY